MAKYVVRLDELMEEELARLFSRVGDNGIITKHLVSMVGGKLRAEVRADEHPPPHFHIVYDGEDASFDIITGVRLPNVYGLERFDGMIHLWWKQNRRKIAEKWNNSRPTGCTVGPIPIPQS